MIVTDNLENIRAIMSTQFDCFGKGDMYHKIWSSLMRDSILTTDGNRWQTNRNYLISHVGKIRPTDTAVTDRHAQNLIRVLSDGEPHDTLDQLNRFAIDAVTDIFYGTSTNTLLTRDQSLRDAIQRHKDRNSVRTLFGTIGARMSPDQEAVNVIDKYLDKVVQQFSIENSESLEERDRKAQTLLGHLSAQDLPKSVLKDQLVAVLVGGRDSVAIIVTWALYELSLNPSILAKLRTEILNKIGLLAAPSQIQLESMAILDNVVQETMRVHSSVGINSRVALKDATLPAGGGPHGESPIGILAGTTLVMGLDSVHRRPTIYGPDADVFNSHRWDNNWRPDAWSFFPFNRGPRICLGKNLALMEVKFVLCRVVQAFGRIEWVERNGVDGQVAVVQGERRAKGMRTKMAFNTKPAEVVWLRFGK